jgi:hypothetical protein
MPTSTATIIAADTGAAASPAGGAWLRGMPYEQARHCSGEVSGTAGAACEAFSKAVTGPIFFA